MTDHPDGHQPGSGWPPGIVVGEQGAVRVFWLTAPHMQGLVDRLALVLSEHLDGGDELHVTYNAMQSAWRQHPPQTGSVLRPPAAGWTELCCEYSALAILRGARQ